jgi:hypothetical protein
MDRAKVDKMVRAVTVRGAESAAKLMADEQRRATRSRRLAADVTHESGVDERGVYARAGMAGAPNAFFWHFEEYRTGRGEGHQPFIRPSLLNNTDEVARRLLGR